MKVKSYSKAQSGFTLIELVVVIVILGILAATAIPRFSDMSNAAKVAAVSGMQGAVQSATAIAHAQSLVSTASVTMEGQTIAMTRGYPSPTAAGIGATMSANDGFQFNPSGTTVGRWELTKGSTPATCAVIYTFGASDTVPTIAPATGGC